MAVKKRKADPDEGNWQGADYYNPTTSSGVEIEILRKQYLLLASELYGVTAALRDAVLPHFHEVGASLDEEPARTALEKWGGRFQLTPPWVRKQVEATLNLWRLVPDVAMLGGERPLWHPLFSQVRRRPKPGDSRPFTFSFQESYFEVHKEGIRDWEGPAGWNPERDRREAFIAEARRQFKTAIETYCDEEERAAQERGLRKLKRTRERLVTPRMKVAWAVHRHCGGLGFDAIAQKHQEGTGHAIDQSVIIKAVKDIALLLELRD